MHVYMILKVKQTSWQGYSYNEHTCTHTHTRVQSSLNTGDTATLRTRLQARRATLNEEICKEDKFHKGSKRLVGASVDPKTKDQAALEMNFAESKIKALQSELSKINSSLQAYQAAG